MKQLYKLCKFFFVVLLLLLGIPLIFMRLDQIYAFAFEQAEFAYTAIDGYYEELLLELPESFREWVRPAVAGVMVAFGLFMVIWSLFRPKKERSISFQGMHGEVTIELKDIESTLEHVLMKLPEVKRASIRLEPADSPGRVIAWADAILFKDADDDARMVTARVQAFLLQHTRKILGLQDVEVHLNVSRFLMNMKTVKPEILLLEAPSGGAPGSEGADESSDLDLNDDRIVNMPVPEASDEIEVQR